MKWHKEPLLHFLIIGAVLFGISRFLAPGESSAESRKILITAQEIEGLKAKWRAREKKEPTREEVKNLVRDRVWEEVFYREALREGLDKEDSVVRTRLAEKFQFLSRDESAAPQPAENELRTFFQNTRDLYRIPAKVCFSHVFFRAGRGEQGKKLAEEMLQKLRSNPSQQVSGLGDFSTFSYEAHLWSPEEVEKNLGKEAAEAALKNPLRVWEGPFKSAHGFHLIRVDERTDSRLPEFEEVKDLVQNEWIEEQTRQNTEKLFNQLKTRYEIFIED